MSSPTAAVKLPRPKKLTPMMRQYLEIKDRHPDCILFFRMGDFYEMFLEDAVLASSLLEITLTSREKGKETAVPMCGVPHHSAANYIAKLVERGHKVAICEQVEDPKTATKLLKRDVVQVVTPGLVTDTEMIDARLPRYLAAAVATGRDGKVAGGWGMAYLDVTTGEFRAADVGDGERLSEELGRVGPHEVLFGGDAVDEVPAWIGPGVRGALVEEIPELAAAKKLLSEHFEVPGLEGFELEGLGPGLVAAAVVLDYVERNHKAALPNVHMLARHVGEAMFIGEATQRNLELFQTLAGGRRQGTLLWLLDRTKTAMGGRLMRRWLAYPLLDTVEIDGRQGAVAELVARGDTRKRMRDTLREVGDLERLSGKVAMRSANGRDLRALGRSLGALPELLALLGDSSSALIRQTLGSVDTLDAVRALLDRALVDDPPAAVADGGIICEGFDGDIDELHAIQKGGRGWIAELQQAERERTGISTLKIGFNRVFGYYIEITKARLGGDNIPENYERRQTLTNAERYVTPELKEMEAKVLGAQERANALEYQRFCELREEMALHLESLRRTSAAIAILDVVGSLADLAVERRYVRPHVHDGYELTLSGARHPVVEAMIEEERFVPNDVNFDRDTKRLIVITGPNMSGKSTILRQTALVALLAQMGSFVPAEAARVGVVDRIFTRVGASDDLARGRSTFMVEMTETATILLNATDRSLVILDEIGRGTSTFDGLSIAWAVAEHIYEIGARTLFATHYHELTDLSRTLEAVENMNVAVKKWQGKIVFLRRLVEGGVSRSYGIEVAELAGLPPVVISRAKKVLENLETAELDETGLPKFAPPPLEAEGAKGRQLDLFLGGDEVKRKALIDELARVGVEELTPLEALLQLDELRKKARELGQKGGGNK